MWVIYSVFLFGFASTVLSQTNRIVINVTEPVRPILENATAVNYYIENLVQQNSHEGQTLSLLFALDCTAVTNCGDRFHEGEKILTAIGNRTNQDLILSITSTSWNATKDDMSGFNRISKYGVKLFFNIPKSMECSKLLNFRNFYLNLEPKVKPMILGVGCDESHLSCNGLFPLLGIPFVGVHLSSEETAGVAESYSFFRRRMSHISSSKQKILKEHAVFNSHQSSEILPTLYSISEYVVGDVCHRRLLASFIDKWTEENADANEIFIQDEHVQPVDLPISNEFSTMLKGTLFLIPNMRSTLEFIPSYFNAGFMLFEQWKQEFKDQLQQYTFKNNLKTVSNNTLEILLIFQDFTNISTVELELNEWTSADLFPNIFVSSLLFNLEHVTEENDTQVLENTKLISLKRTIGCFIVVDDEDNRTYSAAPDAVKACNKINGSLYLLLTSYKLQKKDLDPRDYSFVYENVVRKKLNNVKAFSDFILNQNPKAKIMLEVHISLEFSHKFNYVSNFCDDKILQFNEYYEAILNWANCNNVEIVLKEAVSDHDSLGLLGWFNYLRPISDNLHVIHKLAKLYPYFVLRNYPMNINNWNVDPCINWENGRPVIKANYFQNKYIGTVFNANQIRQNQQLTTNEYKIMLQFIMKKFNIAEVLLRGSITDFIVACNWVETNSNLIDTNKTILLSYRISWAKNSRKLESSDEEMLSLFEKLRKNRLKSVHGIHVDLATNASNCMNDPSHPILKLLDQTYIKNIKFGILLDYNCCMNYIELLVSSNASSQQILTLLSRIEYLVCQEKHQIEVLTNKATMGKVLDSQLYLKKAFLEFSPHLQLYFRVTLTDISPPIGRHSDAYMQTVSHFMQSATAYDLSYFIIQAFDEQATKIWWWKIVDFNDLSNPVMFIEKESESSNQETWLPDALSNDFMSGSINPLNPYVISTIAVCIVLILSVAVGAFFYWRYKRLSQFLSDEEVKEFVNGRSNRNAAAGTKASDSTAEYMTFNTEYKLRISDLQIDIETILGKGTFGTVYKGCVKECQAAIKTPNKNCSKACFKSFLFEVKILCWIGKHSNFVGFLGAYTNEIQRGVLYIATEFCANGSLEKFLRKKSNVVAYSDEHVLETIPERECTVFFEELCTFAIEIACGMEHLERKQVVHGDLSARNVLLDENYTCKITDFGLSRKLYDYQKYVKKSQEPLPWKWLAYESLAKMEFTSKSDVWSYGVTAWEIFSLGKIPYDTLNWTTEFSSELKNGLRLNKPEFASQEIFTKLLNCWNLDPTLRPTFTELAMFFKEMNKPEYIVLNEA